MRYFPTLFKHMVEDLAVLMFYVPSGKPILYKKKYNYQDTFRCGIYIKRTVKN